MRGVWEGRGMVLFTAQVARGLRHSSRSKGTARTQGIVWERQGLEVHGTQVLSEWGRCKEGVGMAGDRVTWALRMLSLSAMLWARIPRWRSSQ